MVASRLTPLDPGDHAGAPSLTTGTATGTPLPPRRGAPSPVVAQAQQVGGPRGVGALSAPPVAFSRMAPGASGPRQRADAAAVASELRAVYWEAIRVERTACYAAPTVASVPALLVRFVAAVLPGVPRLRPLLAPPSAALLSPPGPPRGAGASPLSSPTRGPQAAAGMPTDAQLFAQAFDDKIALALMTDAGWARPWGNARQSAPSPGEDDEQTMACKTDCKTDRTTSVLLLVDVAGLTVRVDAPDDWADPLLAVLCRRCPALPPRAPSGDGATLPSVAAGAAEAAGTAYGGTVGYAWVFFDSSATATLPLPHLGRTLSAPTGGMVRQSASLGDRSSAPQDPVCDLVCDLLAQARWLLIDAACQRCGVQTHWAATRAEADALLALWGPSVSPTFTASDSGR